MGLDTTHDCWHGSYSSFGHWRSWIAERLGLPPLELMEGFYDEEYAIRETEWKKRLPIKWKCLVPDIIYELLDHSDCEGEIAWESCNRIAERLSFIVENCPQLPELEWYIEKTTIFAMGLREAALKQENVEFH